MRQEARGSRQEAGRKGPATKLPPSPARPGDAEWNARLDELRACQRLFRQVGRILGLTRDSTKAEVIHAYLLNEIFRLAFSNPKRSAAMLQELQRALKALPQNSIGRKERAIATKSLKQHLEQLYGPGVVVEEAEDEEQEKAEKPE